MLEIETVGVQAERKMQEAHEAMQALAVTANGAPMQGRLLTPQEQVRAGVEGGTGLRLGTWLFRY